MVDEHTKKVRRTAIITIAVIALLVYYCSQSSIVKDAGSLDAKITNVNCGDETAVEYILWNFSTDRVDFYRVVITATDKVSGKETCYQVKENGGILGNARLEKRMIIGVFDCKRYDFKIAVYHF